MNVGTLLLRQVHPSWVQQGHVTSQAFKPMPKDQKKLSVYNGDLIDAEAAWAHFTGRLGYHSAGVLGVTVGECNQNGLQAAPDPQEKFPEHATIDFSPLADNQIEKAAKRLRTLAVNRGWQFQAENA